MGSCCMLKELYKIQGEAIKIINFPHQDLRERGLGGGSHGAHFLEGSQGCSSCLSLLPHSSLSACSALPSSNILTLNQLY